MVVLELPWAAEKAVQQFGRVHRSNQISAPGFKILVTDLGGERRFVAAVSHRMKQLGAITKGDRRAALRDSDAGNLGRFDFFTKQGIEALDLLYKELSVSSVHCIGLDGNAGLKMMLNGPLDLLSSPGKGPKVDVRDFLNRLLLLPTRMQQAVFAEFVQLFELKSREADARGELDAGVRSIGERRGDWEVVLSERSRELLHRDPQTGAETHAVILDLDYGYKWEQAAAVFAALDGLDPLEGFYQQSFFDIGAKTYVWDAMHFLLVVAARPKAGTAENQGMVYDASVQRYYWAYYPHQGCRASIGGKLITSHLLADMQQRKLQKVKPDKLAEVKRGWQRQYHNALTMCRHKQHNQHCKNKGFCTDGKRAFQRIIISGNLLSIYGNVRDAICPHAFHFGTASAGKLELTKAVTREGGRVVGVEVFSKELDAVRYSLRNRSKCEVSSAGAGEADDDELFDAVMQLASATPVNSAKEVHRLLCEFQPVQPASQQRVKQLLDSLLQEGILVKGRHGLQPAPSWQSSCPGSHEG